ncbi:MAG: hypothetical protein LBQ65_07435 [Tannerellaceae bacterium]|jgi:hypothetical protein|nr:hypothetical protein [Tannerellaceae bacterium]
MKKVILLAAAFSSLTFFDCAKNEPLEPDTNLQISSKLVVKVDVATKAGEDTGAEQIVFTGDDILWFNGLTKEIRFQDNMTVEQLLSLMRNGIKFYVDGEYLFSSLVSVIDYDSRIFDSLVFYYSTIENRFYLADGYPDLAGAKDRYLDKGADVSDEAYALYLSTQQKRNENMKAIEAEWTKFINQLKLEEKYRDSPEEVIPPIDVTPPEPAPLDSSRVA